MRGEFDRLVMVPTARELDAALAEVKVRARPIARRRARRRRQLAVLGFLALTVGGAAVGRATAPGLRTIPDEGAAVLRGAAAPWSAIEPSPEGAVTGSVERYHVSVWTEWDGVRYAASEGWVEGPRGVGMRVNHNTFTLNLRPEVGPGATRYRVAVTTRRPLGRTADGVRLEGLGRARLDLAVPSGQALVLAPLGRPHRSEPTTYVRVVGPHGELPAGEPQWQRPDPARASRWPAWWPYAEPVDLGTEWRIARRAGVRFTGSGFSATFLPLMQWQSFRVELRAGGGPAVEVEVGHRYRSGLRVPGVPDTMAIGARVDDEVCVVLLKRQGRGWRGHEGNRACLVETEPRAPVPVRGPRGERLTVRFLP